MLNRITVAVLGVVESSLNLVSGLRLECDPVDVRPRAVCTLSGIVELHSILISDGIGRRLCGLGGPVAGGVVGGSCGESQSGGDDEGGHHCEG